METSIKNYGVIEGQRNTDYVAGVLPYEIRNSSGDWTQFLPLEEWQWKNGQDTMACVSFSALNSLEAQYYMLTGERKNFSDRFTAYMSGTTPQGNYLWKVGDSIRHDGVVDESDWPAPASFDWATYYTPPPIEVINKAKLFKYDWDVAYEFIDFSKDSLMYHLKQSPIQVVIPGHAVMNFLTTSQVIKYFDTYSPFIKETTQVGSALKYVLTKKPNMLRFVKLVNGKDVWLVRDGKRSLVYNASAMSLIGDWSKIETISQAEFDALPDTGKVILAADQE